MPTRVTRVPPVPSSSRRHPAAVAAALVSVVGVTLAGCGGSAYDGTGTAACPALPGDVVAAVAGDLSAEGKGPESNADRPQSGSLPPPSGSSNGILYRCQWATTDGGNGLQVYLEASNADGVAEDTAYLRQQQGPELAAPVSGYGRAFLPGGTGDAQARWACDFRTLEVNLYSPKAGTDPVAGVKRLTEALVPEIGCPP